jgi:hypothetical protein
MRKLEYLLLYKILNMNFSIKITLSFYLNYFDFILYYLYQMDKKDSLTLKVQNRFYMRDCK